MSFLLGRKRRPQLLRENKRMLDKSIRDIERERQGLQTQEKKLIAEIKKSAKQGQMVDRIYIPSLNHQYFRVLNHGMQVYHPNGIDIPHLGAVKNPNVTSNGISIPLGFFTSRNITHCNYLTTPFMNQPSYPRSHIAKPLKSQLWSIQKILKKTKPVLDLNFFHNQQ
ncbi:hypothetical protein Hdeb2414_s0001g00040061 [Helianthus debilis subsp. tardiflorus]